MTRAALFYMAMCTASTWALRAPEEQRQLQYSFFGGRLGQTFNLSTFGAIGDNATLNTKAFVAGVLAVKAARGGTLVVPDGVFITAPFNLTSNMTLFLTRGAVIRGSCLLGVNMLSSVSCHCIIGASGSSALDCIKPE